jgi:glycosyltransferase involved in cell wall biosynthesis
MASAYRHRHTSREVQRGPGDARSTTERQANSHLAQVGALAMKNPAPRDGVAVLIPCYNEETAVAHVIAAFRTALPGAAIYVYDNNSSDHTVDVARNAGALVCRETLQGKGHVVRRMFADIDADVYVLVDGDATYDAPSVRLMIDRLVAENLDMMVAARVECDKKAYRFGHRIGNALLTGFVRTIFGRTIVDMLSGYRVFSRRFVKSFPVLSGGFEIETELTVHALHLGLPIAEVRTPYYARPNGSHSKLNTLHDGFRILWTILKLFRSEHPLPFFGGIGMLLALVSILLAIPIFATYVEEGIVPRLPTAVLSTGMMLLAFMLVTSGLVLDTVTRGRREMKLLAYLAQNTAAIIRS